MSSGLYHSGGMARECCATCANYEAFTFTITNDSGDELFGHCTYHGEDVDVNPKILTCFEWSENYG